MSFGVPARWVVLVGVLLLAGAGWHYWVIYSNLVHAKSDLLAAREILAGGQLDFDQAQTDRAEARLDSADSNLSTARMHLRWDPFLQAGRKLPFAGRQVDAVYRLSGMGSTLVELGDEATAAVDLARTTREERAGEPVTATAVEVLDRTGPNLEHAEQLLAKLSRQRAELGDGSLVGPLADARNRLDRELPGLEQAFAALRAWQPVLPAMLGFQGDRRYLVLALNNGEILPGGGLVTAAGIMEVSNGQTGDTDLSDTTLWRKTWVSQGGGYIEPPGPLKRYLLQDYPWNLAVSNWSPDFPSWSKKALEFYEMVHGPQQVDGVLAVDLDVLQRLLKLTGPVTIDVAGFGPVEFTEKNAVLELERVTRTSEDGENRKSAVGDLTRVLLEGVQHLPGDQWDELLRTVQDLTGQRHIQMFSFHDDEQAAIERSGLDGALDQGEGDFVMVNEASVLGTKLSMILERAAEHTVVLDGNGYALHTLQLHYRNPLPEWRQGRDPQLVEDLMGTGRYGGYIRLFVPSDAGAFQVEIDGQPTGLEDQGADGDRTWVGVFIVVPSGETRDVTLRWVTPIGSGPGDQYSLRVQKQPGIDELCTRWQMFRDGFPVPVTVNGHPAGPDPVCATNDVTVAPAD